MRWQIPDIAIIGNSFTVASRAAGELADIPSNITFLITGGYYEEGDGGSAQFFKVAGPLTDPASFQSGDGSWWQFCSLNPNVLQFGAKRDDRTFDNTDSFNAMMDYLKPDDVTLADMYAPAGEYRLTNTFLFNKNFIRFYGDGYGTVLYFDPPATDAVLLKLENFNPALLCKFITLENFSYAASTEAGSNLIKKTLIQIFDGSNITIQNVNNVNDSWTGADSIGLHTFGRDTIVVRDTVFSADLPIYGDLNPNSDQFVFDYITFDAVECIVLDPANYGITFAPGVNPSNWSVVNNCGAFRSKGGIWLNNSGVPSVYPATNILIENFRSESGTGSGGDADGYGIHMNFGATKAGNINIVNFAVNDPTCNGLLFNSVAAIQLTNVNCGFGNPNNALVIDNVDSLQICSLGIGDDDAIVDIDSMFEQLAVKPSTVSADNPSISFGIYTGYTSDVPAQNIVRQNGIAFFSKTAILNNGQEIDLPSLGDVTGSMIVWVFCPYGAAYYFVTFTTPFVVTSTPDFNVDGAGVISVNVSPDGTNKLVNNSAGTMRFSVVAYSVQ